MGASYTTLILLDVIESTMAEHDELPGIAFEKAVATIQAQIDPTSTVCHNERLFDRLGHGRQFEVDPI